MTKSIYRYGARPPIDGAATVELQLWLAHRYKNDLVEVELSRRAVVKRIEQEFPPVWCSVTRAKPSGEQDMWRAALSCGHEQDCESVGQPAKNRQLICQTCTDPEYFRRIDAMHLRVGEYRRAVRAAYRTSGLYWGTSGLVDAAAFAASSKSDSPNFQPWRRTGRIGIQIQSSQPLTVAGALACTDSRLRLERVADPPRMTSGSRRSGKQFVLYLRVGSNERAPVWAQWPVTLHRLPPLDARITGAWMQRACIGPDYRWQLALLINDLGSPAADAKVQPDRTGVMAVDLGWRVKSDGLRVGYWRDDKDNHGEFLVPADPNPKKDLREKMKHARHLDGVRTLAFNKFRTALADWLDTCSGMPDWLQTTATLRQWKSADRLYRLVCHWLRNRWSGDETIADALLAWHNQDRHLSAWCAHEKRKAIGRRNELYRLWAVDVARRIETLVIERFRIPDVAGRRKLKNGASDAEKVRADRASSVRQIAAPGTFRRVLIEACWKRGVCVYEVPAEWTTIDCSNPECGKRLLWDPAPKIKHRCAACGTPVDQDDQACRNLLKLLAGGKQIQKTAKTPAGGLSAKQRRFRRRKRDRMAAKFVDSVAHPIGDAKAAEALISQRGETKDVAHDGET